MLASPILLFAYGNISRGDDALAPLLQEQLRQQTLSSACGHPLKFLTDFQIQIEHVMDMRSCERVLIMDADQSLDRPYHFYPVTGKLETHYTTHGMSPSTLLHTYHQVFNEAAPPTSMLAIQGFSFELGESLSGQARKSLELANQFLTKILSRSDFSVWDSSLNQKNTCEK